MRIVGRYQRESPRNRVADALDVVAELDGLDEEVASECVGMRRPSMNLALLSVRAATDEGGLGALSAVAVLVKQNP